MHVTPIEHGLDLLATNVVRSPGLHASDIYGELFKALEPDRYDRNDPPNPVLLALGTAWELHLERLLRLNGIHVERADEQRSPEGIWFTPDLLFFNGSTRLGEIKLTSMSAHDMPTSPCTRLPTKMDKFLCQMQLYAYWLELYEGWLAVLFLHTPWCPDLRVFDLTWTDRDLQTNYQMCMNFARSKGQLI